MQVWALKGYTKDVPAYVQVLKTQTMERIEPFLGKYDCCISLEDTRFRLLSLAALYPGSSTLIGNLIRTTLPTVSQVRTFTGSARPLQAPAMTRPH